MTATGQAASTVAPLDDARIVQRARFLERLRIDGTRMDGDIADRVLAARLVRSYDAATSLELTCDDHDFLLLQSGLLTRRGRPRKPQLAEAAWARFGQMRLTLDGAFFRLAGVSGQYTASARQMTLTFEDEVASLMRRHKGPEHWSRARATRAEFIQHLAARVKENPIVVRSPELREKQTIKGDSDRARRRAREKGIAHRKRLTVGGSQMTPEQKRNIETSLTVADDLRAGERATLVMLVAGVGESGFKAIMNLEGSPYGGVFGGKAKERGGPWDIKDTEGMARSFLLGGKGFQAGGAIKAAAENPTWSPGTIAYKVEGSRANFNSDRAAEGHYQQWLAEAEDILAAWGGAGEVSIVRKQYTFDVDRNQNYWDAAGELAQEVRWRLFADENELWYVSDEWLFKRRPTFLIQPHMAALLGFTFSADVVEDPYLNEFQTSAIVARWVGPPGSTVELEDLGPFDGRWLLATNEQDLFTEESVLTFRRPAPKLPEPAADREQVLQTESTPERGTTRQRIVQAAKKALAHREAFLYQQIRPMPKSLLKPKIEGQAPISGQPIIAGYVVQRMDCSAFATLVYKAAGAADPNNRGYDGAGYTGTLAANGEKTNDPQPGDLAFYGSGPPFSHVAVYIGGGQCIGFGSNPVKQHATRYRTDFYGFRTYDLDG